MNAQLYAECAERVWAMDKSTLLAMLKAIRGETPLVKPVHAAQSITPTRAGAVAVIPIYGLIMPMDSFILEFFGGTSIERFRKSFRDALADDSVSGILLKIASGGGDCSMVASMADEIFAARGRKPITAYTETMAGSAAYWLGTQAEQFYAAKDARVGSIGCYLEHFDISKSLEMEGISVELIYAGEHKVDNTEYGPLTPETRSPLQKWANDVNGMFRSGIARGRGVTEDFVDANFGQGLMFFGKDAERKGMITKVAKLDEVVAMVTSSRRRAMAADADALPIMAAASDMVDPPVIVLTDLPSVPEPVAEAVEAVGDDPDALALLAAEADADALTATMAMLARL